jgi:DNA-binding transcriptional MerR regulator
VANSYTLADLVRVTGAKRRSLQLWADAGVIEPERGTNRAGTGTHRRFSREQAIVACIIRGFAERQMAIGELLTIAKRIRAFFRSDDRVKPLVESVIKGEADLMLILETWMEGRNPSSVIHTYLPGGLGVLSEATATRMKIKFGLMRPGYSLGLAEIRRESNQKGEEVVFVPVAHFERPESLAVAIRLRTYLSKIDS